MENNDYYIKWELSWKERKSLRCTINALEGILRFMRKHGLMQIPYADTVLTYEQIERLCSCFKAQLKLAKGVKINGN